MGLGVRVAICTAVTVMDTTPAEAAAVEDEVLGYSVLNMRLGQDRCRSGVSGKSVNAHMPTAAWCIQKETLARRAHVESAFF